jgi:hypothetical protein
LGIDELITELARSGKASEEQLRDAEAENKRHKADLEELTVRLRQLVAQGESSATSAQSAQAQSAQEAQSAQAKSTMNVRLRHEDRDKAATATAQFDMLYQIATSLIPGNLHNSWPMPSGQMAYKEWQPSSVEGPPGVPGKHYNSGTCLKVPGSSMDVSATSVMISTENWSNFKDNIRAFGAVIKVREAEKAQEPVVGVVTLTKDCPFCLATGSIPRRPGEGRGELGSTHTDEDWVTWRSKPGVEQYLKNKGIVGAWPPTLPLGEGYGWYSGVSPGAIREFTRAPMEKASRLDEAAELARRKKISDRHEAEVMKNKATEQPYDVARATDAAASENPSQTLPQARVDVSARWPSMRSSKPL